MDEPPSSRVASPTPSTPNASQIEEARARNPVLRSALVPPPSPTSDVAHDDDSHPRDQRPGSPSEPQASRDASSPTSERERNRNKNLYKWESNLNPSLTLVNSGSVARDHLASERTYLAYVRTSLAIASMGVALVQLFTISSTTSESLIHRWARPMGATAVLLGFFTLIAGITRFFTVQAALPRGEFPVARTIIIVIALVLASLIVIVFSILLVVRDQ